MSRDFHFVPGFGLPDLYLKCRWNIGDTIVRISESIPVLFSWVKGKRVKFGAYVGVEVEEGKIYNNT